MKYIYIITLFVSLFLNSLVSQTNSEHKFVSERSNFSFGLTGGYNSIAGNFSLYLGYRIFKFVEFNVNGGANRLEGGAFSYGIRVTPLKDRRILPYLGLNFNSHSAGAFEVKHDSLSSFYKNTPNYNLLYQIGLIYERKYYSFLFSINYKQVLKQSRLILDRGVHDLAIEQRADRVYKSGIGVTFGMIFHIFDKNSKNSDYSKTKNQAQF